MKPVDIRNENFAALQKRIGGDEQRVLEAWRVYGPGTTRQVSEKSGIYILTLRPRTTALVEFGLVAMVDRDGHEGIYRVRTEAEWQAWHAALHLNSGCQPELDLKSQISNLKSRTEAACA